jgi:protein-S-isoprenylcysteine O-methyltransferase Ste14
MDSDSDTNSRNAPIQRTLGIAFGVGTQALFLVTVWFLFWFLKDGGLGDRSGDLWIDVLLAMQFAVPHSLLLLPSVRKFLGKWIIQEFYPLFYCVVTCVNLLVTIGFWRSSDTVLWELHGMANVVVQAMFYASWFALFYSQSLTGFGSQHGLPQWLRWVRRRPMPAPTFSPRGAYHWLRHPIYLSFAGLIWFTPRMTLDHAILTGLWTTYILFGSYLKDLRLTHYVGDAYRVYQQRVTGFPLMPFGPLSRRKVSLAGDVLADDYANAVPRQKSS